MHPSLSRRQLLKGAFAGAATLFIPATPLLALQVGRKQTYPFTLPKLDYAFDALEPHIDARTMEIHHGKHHQAYVTNLNNALKEHADLHKVTLDQIVTFLRVPEDIKMAVRNNAGGHLNHTMFWSMMAKKGGGEPKGQLSKAIDAKFGSYDKFQDAFSKAAATRFGSGWAWLIVAKGELAVTSTPNQDTPVMRTVMGVTQGTPILGLDVWEHAYYLKYQNMRPAYVKAWWNVVNWEDATDRYNTAMKG